MIGAAAQVAGPIIGFGSADQAGSLSAPASIGDASAALRGSPGVLTDDGVPDVLVGPDDGSRLVRLLSGVDGSELASGHPFGSAFTGGVRVAYSDLTGDGVADPIVAMGAGGGFVRLFDGATLTNVLSGHPFGPTFTGGVFVAAGDVSGDGRADVVVAQGAGGGEVRVYDAADGHLLAAGAPFGPGYSGGVRVAAGDVNGDGRADVIAAQASGGLVSVFDGAGPGTLVSGFPYGAGFRGGVFVAAGDVNADGQYDVVVAPGTGNGPVIIVDGRTHDVLGTFAAYAPGFSGGVRVAVADLTGDGRGDIITAPGGGGLPVLRVFDGATFSPVAEAFAYDPGFSGGVFVAAPTSSSRLRFTSASTTTFTIGVAGTFSITTSGVPPAASVTETGALPDGVTFTDNGDGTATLAGSPATGSGGTYSLTLTATNGVAADATQTFTLEVVDTAPRVTATMPADGATSVPIDAPLVVTFNEPVNVTPGAFSLQCPPGTPVAVTVPTASPAAQFTIDPTVDLPATTACSLRIAADQVTDADADDPPDTLAADVMASFTTSACAAISVSPTTLVGGNVTVPYGPVTFTQAGGVAPITWSVTSGSLPAGLTLAASTGELSGTPTAAGAFAFTVTATAASGCTGDAPLTLNVAAGPNQPPSFAAGPDQAVNEDSGPQSVAPWATAISPGPPDEAGQTVTFDVTGNTNPGLFSVPPAVSPSGTLTYLPAANVNGTATITLVAKDDGGTALGGVDTSAPQSFTITVNALNDAPSFVAGADVTVLENVGQQTFPAWATALSAGPADEAAQTLSFAVTANTNPALFAVPPVVSSSGELTFEPASITAGTATITLTLQDSGGTALGGIDTSAPQTFTITVTGVNTSPSFTVGANQTVAEDGGAQTVPGWATDISPGPPDEAGQTVTFNVIGNTNAALFSAAPAISPAGTLTYTPAANVNGTATITLVLQDDGGTADGGLDTSPPQNFTITVNAVNDAPSFTVGADVTVSENVGQQTFTPWATAISAGPADEAAQTLSFAVTANTNPALFSLGPAVSSSGELTFTPASNAAGTATITLTLQDSGGTALGGIDTSAPQTFTITITGVNSAPSFAVGPNLVLTEDSGAQLVNPWATAISPGPADEASQNVTFNVTGNTNPALFSAAPAVSPTTGVLTFTPAANASGTATITLTLSDDGGTAGGGVDTSAPQDFTITVTEVNDAPSFVAGAGPTVLEDAGAQSISNWATSISPGPASEAGQTLTFIVTGNTNASLFAAGGAPAVSSTGTLTYTSSPNAFGTADITLVLQDSGGTAGGGVDTSAPHTFTVTVTPVNDAPMVANEVFDILGNTEFRVDQSPGATPHTLEATTGPSPYLGVLDNDSDPEGDPFAVTAIVGCADASAPFDCTLPDGAVVHVEATGAFSITPAPGATTASFTYTATDTPAAGVAASTNGTVIFTVVGMIWYVDGDAAGPGTGTSADPFDDFTATNVNGAGGSGDLDAAGDYIFVHDSTINSGITLEAGQHLVAEFAGLSIDQNLNGNGAPTVVVAAGGSRSVISNSGNAIAMTDAVPAEIRGFSLTSTAGDAINLTTNGALTGAPALTIAGNAFIAAGGEGIDVAMNAGTSGTLGLVVQQNVWNPTNVHTGNSINVVHAAGAGILHIDVSGNTNLKSNGGAGIFINGGDAASTVVTGFSGNSVHGDTAGAGVSVQNVMFDATPGGTLNALDGGVTLIGAPGNGVGGAGLVLSQVTGALDFVDLDVFADGSSALSVTGLGAFTGATGTRITVTAGASTVVGPVGLTNLTADLQLAGLTVAGSSTSGVALTNVAGVFTAPASASITNAAAAAFAISGGDATVTYAGTINDDLGPLVNISGATGGVKTFSGAITDGNDGDGGGISLGGNGGATIVFSGGLTLSTGATPAFTATGGGTVHVCDENPCSPVGTGALVNTLTTTTATALNVTNTTIGANNLEFRSISSNGGSAAGIILSNTGTGGGLKIKGTGGAGSGGTIANKTGSDGDLLNGIGISLNSTANVSIDRMQLNDFQNNAIRGLSVSAFRLTNTVISGANGNNSAGSDGAISFGTSNPSGANGLLGTGASASLIDSVDVSGAIEHTIEVYNQSGSFGLTISNSNIHDNTVASGSDGILVETQGTSTATIRIAGNSFSNLKSQGIQLNALDNSAVDLTISGNTVTRGTQGNEGIVLANAANARLTTLVENNTISGFGGVGIFVGQGPGNATSSSLLHATIRGNTVTSPASATNHSIIAFLTSTVGQISQARLLIDDNTVTQASTTGVARGILVDTPDTNTTPAFHATVTNNDVAILDNVGGVGGIVVQSRRDVGRFAVSGNVVTYPNGTPGGILGIRVRQAAPGSVDLERGVSASNDAAVVLAENHPSPHLSGTEILGTVTVINNGIVELPSTPPLPLSAGLSGVDADRSVPAARLAAAELEAVARAARTRLSAALTPEQRARLQAVRVTLAGVGDGHVSEYADGRIAIDPAAAGRGWFVDPTPLDDEEFPVASGSERRALPSAAPAGRYDLLTALMHEMHHVLGRSDVQAESRADDLLTATLPPGVRRTVLQTR